MAKKQVTYEGSQPAVDSHSEGCCAPDTESVESQLDIDPDNLQIRGSPTRMTKMLGEGVTKEVNSQMKEQGKNLQ